MTPPAWFCVHCGLPQTTNAPIPCPSCNGRAFASTLSLDVDTVQTILLPLTEQEANA